MPEDFQIKFDVPSLHPDQVSAADLADLIRDLERAIEVEASAGQDAPGVKDAPLPALALVAVREGSSAYGFSVGSFARPSAARILTGLAEGGREWAAVSPEAQELTSRALWRPLKSNIPVRVVTSLTTRGEMYFTKDLPPPEVNKNLYIEGPTSRSVAIVKAGGVRPAASVHLIGEGYRVAVQGPKQVIQKLGGQLYERAVITGTAQWRLSDWRMVLFKVERVDPYPGEDVAGVLAEAAAIAGPVIARKGGVAGFLADQRQEDDEDEE